MIKNGMLPARLKSFRRGIIDINFQKTKTQMIKNKYLSAYWRKFQYQKKQNPNIVIAIGLAGAALAPLLASPGREGLACRALNEILLPTFTAEKNIQSA